MSFTSVPAAGAKVRASVLSALITELRPLFVAKSADETVNNSTTLQNDDQLLLPVEANVSYDLFLRLIINTGTTPDFKYTFTAPTGATGTLQLYTGSNPDTAASSLQGPGTLTATGAVSGVGADQIVIIQGLVVISSTPGTLQFQWAQNTLNASNTSVKTSSYMLLEKKV